MGERLLQGQLFDDQPRDVTPAGFTHLPEVVRGPADQLEELGPVPSLGRFVREVATPDRVSVSSPSAAADYLINHVYAPFDDFDQEELWVLLLNNKNIITHDAMVYRGTVNKALIRMAEVFKAAVQVNAVSLIVAHNHPSGAPSPSPEDVTLTQAVVEAGQLMEIEVVDHIIVGAGRWVSLKEKGLGFKT